MHSYWVYVLASRSRVFYVGVTNNLVRRIWEHRNDKVPGFTQRYRVHRLVHFEQTPDVLSAIAREKQIKGWRREKKIALIEAQNPTWRDLWPEVARG
ncbi:MAG: GIY-YIG nuclease family protein [Burkholderiales bacterium]|nr:GIY-YIG nuclease family protein [Burkholderiales bacterium]